MVNLSDSTALAHFFMKLDCVFALTEKSEIYNTYIKFCKQLKLYQVLHHVYADTLKLHLMRTLSNSVKDIDDAINSQRYQKQR